MKVSSENGNLLLNMVPSKIRLEQGASSRTSRPLLVMEPARRDREGGGVGTAVVYTRHWRSLIQIRAGFLAPRTVPLAEPLRHVKDKKTWEWGTWCAGKGGYGSASVPFACVLVKIWERDVGRRAVAQKEGGRERERERENYTTEKDVRRQKRVQLKTLIWTERNIRIWTHSRINVVDLKRCLHAGL